MPVETFLIYEVPNSYISFGGSPTIAAIFTLEVTDDDGDLDGSSGTDGGTAQTFDFDDGGGTVNNYQFYYNDEILVDGTDVSVKTFQLTINGTTRTFIMSDSSYGIEGLDVGESFSLEEYAGYTPIDYDDLPCFVRGTRIATERGQVQIEDLQVGDMVKTADHGFQPIRWIGSSQLSHRDLLARPHLCPVHIEPGALAEGLPKRDLCVSPQHRVLLQGWQVELNFGLDQVLVPAKSLLGNAGVESYCPDSGVEYFHVMFDEHQVIYSEGQRTESFLVGEAVRDGMDQAQLDEIFEIFPELAEDFSAACNSAARPILRSFEVAAMGAG